MRGVSTLPWNLLDSNSHSVLELELELLSSTPDSVMKRPPTLVARLRYSRHSCHCAVLTLSKLCRPGPRSNLACAGLVSRDPLARYGLPRLNCLGSAGLGYSLMASYGRFSVV